MVELTEERIEEAVERAKKRFAPNLDFSSQPHFQELRREKVFGIEVPVPDLFIQSVGKFLGPSWIDRNLSSRLKEFQGTEFSSTAELSDFLSEEMNSAFEDFTDQLGSSLIGINLKAGKALPDLVETQNTFHDPWFLSLWIEKKWRPERLWPFISDIENQDYREKVTNLAQGLMPTFIFSPYTNVGGRSIQDWDLPEAKLIPKRLDNILTQYLSNLKNPGAPSRLTSADLERYRKDGKKILAMVVEQLGAIGMNQGVGTKRGSHPENPNPYGFTPKQVRNLLEEPWSDTLGEFYSWLSLKKGEEVPTNQFQNQVWDKITSLSKQLREWGMERFDRKVGEVDLNQVPISMNLTDLMIMHSYYAGEGEEALYEELIEPKINEIQDRWEEGSYMGVTNFYEDVLIPEFEELWRKRPRLKFQSNKDLDFLTHREILSLVGGVAVRDSGNDADWLIKVREIPQDETEKIKKRIEEFLPGLGHHWLDEEGDREGSPFTDYVGVYDLKYRATDEYRSMRSEKTKTEHVPAGNVYFSLKQDRIIFYLPPEGFWEDEVENLKPELTELLPGTLRSNVTFKREEPPNNAMLAFQREFPTQKSSTQSLPEGLQESLDPKLQKEFLNIFNKVFEMKKDDLTAFKVAKRMVEKIGEKRDTKWFKRENQTYSEQDIKQTIEELEAESEKEDLEKAKLDLIHKREKLLDQLLSK